jgi:hypothetical protein
MNRKSNRNTRKNRKAIARHRLNPSLFIVPKVERQPAPQRELRLQEHERHPQRAEADGGSDVHREGWTSP